MDYKQELKNYLSTCSGNVLNVFYEIYQIIKRVEENQQPEAIMYYIDIMPVIKSDKSYKIKKDYYTDKQLDTIRKKFQKKNVKNLILDEASKDSKNNVQPIDFYRKIWNKLSAICKNDKEAAYALFLLVDSDLIPYRSVGTGISMSNEEYAAGINKIRKTVFDDTVYILNLDYNEKTQYASLLVDKLLSLEDKNLQAIYMALVIKIAEENIKDSIKNYIEDL